MSPVHAPQLVQESTHSRIPWRLSRSHSYGQSSRCNATTHHQAISSFPETSPRSRLYDQPTVSLISTYSGLSSSGSSNTQEQPSPVTPDFHYSPDTTLESHRENSVAVFLSEFCDPDNEPNGLVPLSGLDSLWERDAKSLRNKRLPELPVSCVADRTSQGEENSTEASAPMPLGHHSIPIPVGIGKPHRFCRDFGGPSRLNPNLIHDEFSPNRINLRTTHSPSLLTSSLKNDLLPPPSGSDISKLFSERETAAVREFLRVWGSNNGAKVARSKSALGEDEAPGGGSDDSDDYSWEAVDTEDGDWDPKQCSMLLQEVGEMVGLPPESPMDLAIASTPPASSTLDRFAHNGQGMSQDSDFPSFCHSAALARSSTNISDGDDFDFDIGVLPSVHQRVDQPLDVTPQAVTCGLLAGSNAPTRGDQDGSIPVDVPIILASSPDTTSLKNSSCDLLLDQPLGHGRVKSTNSNRRRCGQIFNVEETKVTSTGVVAVHLESTFVPTGESPPPPVQPTLLAKHASALDFSLSKLEAHGSQYWRSSGTESAHARVNASEKCRESLLSTITQGCKYQSGATTRIVCPRSVHRRHFSSPMPDAVPRHSRINLQPGTEPTHARLRERATKLFPYMENQESSMRSFMEMDVVPPKAQAPRRTSKLGRVTARWSQSLVKFGKHFLGSRSVKDCPA